MRFWGLCLLILFLSSCFARKVPRSVTFHELEPIADKAIVLLPEATVSALKVVPVELANNIAIAPMEVVTNQLVLKQKVVKQQGQKQVKQKKAVNQKSMMFSNIKSNLELKKPLLSGPSQFDSRIEPSILNVKIPWQKKIHNNVLSIGIVIEKDKIHAISDTSFQIEAGITLQSRYKLCVDEPFADQPVIGVGTAFIIGKRTMVTAGHVFTEPLENYIIVFGFEMLKEKGKFNTIIAKNNIYYPKKISHKDGDLDLMVFEVTEEITRSALSISPIVNHAIDTEIYMIGYPSGLPAKVALNAEIQENSHPQFFYTSLDAFQGNSGSPVFNMATNDVIGVLVSGEVDYIWNGTCNKSSLCQFPYCKGEKVMKISALADYINP